MPESKRDERYRKLSMEYALARRNAIRSPYKIMAGNPIVHLWEWSLWLPPMAWTVIDMSNSYPLYDDSKIYRVQRVILGSKDPVFTEKHKTTLIPPEPPTIIQHATLDTIEFLKLIAEAKKIRIPLMGVEPVFGVDGGWSGLELIDDYGGFRLNWWMIPPDEWLELTMWASSFSSYLNGHFTLNKILRQRFKRLLPRGAFRHFKPKPQDS